MSTFTKYITITSTALLMAAPLYASQQESPELPLEIKVRIIPLSIPGNKNPTALACVNKDWNKVFTYENQVNRPTWKALWKALHGIETPEDEKAFQIFLNGKLVYKPNENNDEGKIEWLFSKLGTPHNGVFDLSGLGEVDKYVRITTSISTFFEVEVRNNAKWNILIAPHYLINQFTSTTAKPFTVIMPDWKDKAPVGIFCRMSHWMTEDGFEYLTTKSIKELCGTLTELWFSSWPVQNGALARYKTVERSCDIHMGQGGGMHESASKISCLFCEPK